MKRAVMLDDDLIDSLREHLEGGTRGDIPHMQIAANLLRRLTIAVNDSKRGFTPPPVDEEELYKNAPPP
jgi:hypothetical protein